MEVAAASVVTPLCASEKLKKSDCVAKGHPFSARRARCIPLPCAALLVLCAVILTGRHRTVSLAGLHLLYYGMQGWNSPFIRLAMPER